MTWAPAIDVENASAHASKVSISFNEGILIVTSSRICRSQRQRDSFILLKDDGDQGRSRAERRLLPVCRLLGSYRPETGRGATLARPARVGAYGASPRRD